MNAVEDGQYLAKSLGPGLGKVKVGAASLAFRRLEDIDIEKLNELLGRARDLMA